MFIDYGDDVSSNGKDLKPSEVFEMVHDYLCDDEFYICNNISRLLWSETITFGSHFMAMKILKANKPGQSGNPLFDKYVETLGFNANHITDFQSWWSYFPSVEEKHNFVSIKERAESILEVKRSYLKDLIEYCKIQEENAKV